MKKLMLLMLCFTASFAHADSIGLHVNSLRGLNSEQCETLLKAFDGVKVPKIAYLEHTFTRENDDGLDCRNEFLDRFKNKKHVIQVYAENSTCRGRAGRTCESVEAVPKLSISQLNRALEKKDKAVLDDFRYAARATVQSLINSINKNTTVSWIYSLEDDFTNRAFRNLKIEVDKELPKKWIKGRNPNGKIASNYHLYGAKFIELHEAQSRFDGSTYSFSSDGVDADFGHGYKPLKNSLPVSAMFSSLRKIEQSRSNLFTWFWWNNQGVESKFIRPSRRTFIIRNQDVLLINKYLKKSWHQH